MAVALSLAYTTRQTAGPLFWPERHRWLEPQSELYFPGDGTVHDYRWFDHYFVDRLATAARWLDQNAPEGSLVAATPAGAIAYHMRHPVIDMLGLTDAQIARCAPARGGWARAGHMKGDGRYVLSRKPDYILRGNGAVLDRPLDARAVSQKLVRKSEREIWADPGFHASYELVQVPLADAGPFRYFTFFRRRADGAAP